jgi:replicative DNA helicase
MALLSDLLSRDLVRAVERAPGTGLRDLDDLTGGLSPGTVWVILGTPGVGRTVLACQLAAGAAAAGSDTALVLGREPARTAAVNILCSQGRVPEHLLRHGRLTETDRGRLAAASQAVQDWPLRILTPQDERWELSGSTSMPDAAHWLDAQAPPARRVAQVLVMDDLDTLIDASVLRILPLLRAWARSTEQTIVITAPEEALLQHDIAVPELRRDADVVLRVLRPDLHNPEHRRAGEADLHVLRHRQGPAGRLVVAFQGHYRRFVDLE